MDIMPRTKREWIAFIKEFIVDAAFFCMMWAIVIMMLWIIP